MHLPQFPNFAPLVKEHRKQIEDLTSRFDSYSDFNFTSLLCWNIDESAEVSLLNENLIIKLPDYITGFPVFSVLGTNKIDESLKKLSETIKTLSLVPQIVIDNIIEFEAKKVESDRDNHDYIYNLHNLYSLEGGVYKKIRNKISKFERDFASQNIEIEKTSVLTPEVAKRVLVIYDNWAKDPTNASSVNSSERAAICRLLDYSPAINFVLVELLIEGRIVGFSFNEILPLGNAICHFEKALSIHDCTYSYLVHGVSNALIEFGCERINWEQDLGLPGLRQSKTSYRPVEMLKKYTITLA